MRRVRAVVAGRVALAGGQVVLCAAATGAGALLYSGFFGTGQYEGPLFGAAGAATLLAALAAARRWRAGSAVLAAVTGFVAVAAVTILTGGEPAGGDLTAIPAVLGAGLVHGWVRMLSVNLPADPTGELLVTPVLLTWSAAFLSVTGALRSRSLLAPVGPPLVGFAAGLVFSASHPGNRLALSAAFLAAAAALVLVRAAGTAVAPTAGRPPPVRQVLLGVPVLGVVVASAVAATAALPISAAEHRRDPRPLAPGQIVIGDVITPLAALGSQLRQQPPRLLYTVRLDGDDPAHPVDRLRVAALADFDGLTWSSADRFLVAGHRLDTAGNRPASRLVTARVVLDGLTGPFLPAVGSPTRIDARWVGAGKVGYSRSSGVLLTDQPSLRAERYDVTGVVVARDDRLRRATPSSGPGYAAAVALPAGLPPALPALARELTREAPTPYERLVAIERYLRTLPYSLDAAPGQSYAAVTRLLTGHGPDDRIGYAEQRAAAFAVLARALGFPTRVAVGHLLRPGPGALHPVTTRDTHAWNEVHFDSHGWVAFDPTEPRRPAVPRNQPSPSTEPSKAAPPPGGASPASASPARRTPPATGTAAGDQRGLPAELPVAGLLAGILLPLLAAVPGAAKVARRRRRRRHGSGRDRILGAWYEATDRLLEHGSRAEPAQTAAEAARRLGAVHRPAGATLTALAPLVTAAVFSPDEPAPQDVTRAWALAGRLTGDLYRRVSLRRLRGWLDPRPLLASHSAARHARSASRQLRGRRRSGR